MNNWIIKKKLFPHLFAEFREALLNLNECMKYEDHLNYYAVGNNKDGYKVCYHRRIKGQTCGSGHLGNDKKVHTQGTLDQKFSNEQEARDFAKMMNDAATKQIA